MIKISNDIYIHFALEKEIGKIIILKKPAETPTVKKLSFNAL